MSSSWRSLLFGLIVLSVTSSARAEEFQDKDRHFSLSLPKEWKVIPPDAIAEINKTVGPHWPGQKISYQTGFQLTDRPPQDYPHILVQYVPGAGSRSYDDIQRSLQKQGEELKKILVGAIVLDRERNRVRLRYELDLGGTGKVEGTAVGFLGKDGIVYLHCQELKDFGRRTLPAFEKIVDSFHYEPGYEFQPSSSAWGTPAILAAVAGGIGGVIGGAAIVLWRRRRNKAIKTGAR